MLSRALRQVGRERTRTAKYRDDLDHSRLHAIDETEGTNDAFAKRGLSDLWDS